MGDHKCALFCTDARKAKVSHWQSRKNICNIKDEKCNEKGTYVVDHQQSEEAGSMCCK